MVLQFLSTIIVFVKYKHGVIDSPVIIVKSNSVVYTYFRSIDIGDVASSVLLKILITLDVYRLVVYASCIDGLVELGVGSN